MRTLPLSNARDIPVLGLGSWRMGEAANRRAAEVAAVRDAIAMGYRLIDTAEMYGEGGAETVLGQALAEALRAGDVRRDELFIVSKVYPHNASRRGTPEACERSLKRLGLDTVDLYLLHWRGQYPLEETVEAFERLREEGKIGRWGVSNFDVDDMEELASPACATNQVLYNLQERGIEFDLLPWSQRQHMPIMAYCPVGQGGHLLKDHTVQQIAERHRATPAQIALAWLVRQDNVIAIPKATQPEHVRLNAEAANLQLESQDLAALDLVFPKPDGKQRLAMV